MIYDLSDGWCTITPCFDFFIFRLGDAKHFIIRMKRLLLLMSLLFAVTQLSSAQTQESKIDYKESSARTLEPNNYIFAAPLIADIQIVGERITHTEIAAFSDYIVDENILTYISEFKKVALGRALQKYNADALVGTLFNVITNESGHIEISVSGYPARYTNFRNATAPELSLLREAVLLNDRDASKEAISAPDIVVKSEKVEKVKK